MKTSTASILIGGLAAAQQASAHFGSAFGGDSYWGDSSSYFNCPSNSNNECTDSQKSGWDWSGIALGADVGSSYSGFAVSGLTCSNKFGKRDGLTKRHFSSKCASGSIGKTITKNPKIECSGEQKNKGFSVGEFHVSTGFDTNVEFHYGMPDGSTCKHTSHCSYGGTTVKNEQCGGATSVSWKLPDDSENDDCEFGIHSIGWECGSNGGSATSTAFSAGFTHSAGTTIGGGFSAGFSEGFSAGTTLTGGFNGGFSEGFSAGTTVSGGFEASTLISIPAVNTPVYTPSFVFPTGGSPSIGFSSVVTPAVPVITTPAAAVSSDVSGGSKSSQLSIPFSANGTIPAGFTASTVYATSVYTVTSCAPEVTNCPARSGTPQVVTSIVAVSTTICPVSETGVASAPVSSGVSGEASTPGFGGFPSGSAPASTVVSSSVSSATSAAPSADCPGLLPKCLNTWIHKVGCKSNTDYDCYCKDADFTKKVIDCVDAWGATDDEIAQGMSYLTGICAAFVPENPGLITNVPTSVTLGVPSTSGVASQTPAISSGVEGVASTPAASIVTYEPSTVYATSLYTVTSCAPEVTNCPARSGTPEVKTSLVVVSTTSVPVTIPAASAPAGSASAPVSSGVEGVASSPVPTPVTSLSTSTIYSTAVSTIATTDESGSSTDAVVTQTISVGTTICPVTATETPAVSETPAISSGVEGVASTPVAPVTTVVTSLSTSTLYSTAVSTVATSDESGSSTDVVVTQTISVGTTICPVTATQTAEASVPAVSETPAISSGVEGVASTPVAPVTTVVTSLSTSTLYSTAVSTIATSDESGSSTDVIVTQTVSVGTTICPVTATQTAEASAPVSSGVEGVASSPAVTAPASAGVTAAPSAPAAGSSAPVPVVSSGVEGVTSAPSTGAPVTTISFVQTVTVPCTATEGESIGSTIAGSSTTSVISTAITVPQVAFNTQTVTVSGVPTVQTGLVQGTPQSVEATPTSTAAPVASTTAAVDGGAATLTLSSVYMPPATYGTPIGTPAGTPVSTPPAFTGAASHLKAGSMAGAGLVAALFMF